MWNPVKRLYKALDGLKTLLFGAFSLALYAADQWDMIDLTPLLVWMFGEEYATKLAAHLTVAFLVLRLVSSSGVKWPWNKEHSEPAPEDDPNREPY